MSLAHAGSLFTGLAAAAGPVVLSHGHVTLDGVALDGVAVATADAGALELHGADAYFSLRDVTYAAVNGHHVWRLDEASKVWSTAAPQPEVFQSRSASCVKAWSGANAPPAAFLGRADPAFTAVQKVRAALRVLVPK
jgi:hypothetical protein